MEFINKLISEIKQKTGGNFSVGPFTSNTSFSNWSQTVVSKTPVLFPESDADLLKILDEADANGLKVRVVGTAHSFDGIVSQTWEENVVILSLAKYQPPAEWKEVLNEPLLTVRMGAGQTFLDLMSFARPKGYVMVTQTAGWFFSLAGVLMNPSVHGATFHEDRLTSILVAVRVMLADGSIKVIDTEEEMKYWRGSLGLLGIVTAVEVRMRKDEGIAMSYTEKKMVPWTEKVVMEYINEVERTVDAAEWFFDPYNDVMCAFTINFKSDNGDDGFKPEDSEKFYVDILKKHKGLNMPTDPEELIPTMLTMFAKFKESLDQKDFSKDFTWVSNFAAKNLWNENYANGPRDGYYVDPNTIFRYRNLGTLIPCLQTSTVFNTLNITRKILKLAYSNKHSVWAPPIPIEFRYVDVKKDILKFEYLEPKRYFSIEVFNFFHKDINVNKNGQVFLELESEWRKIHPGQSKIHFGKEWGFVKDEKGVIEPFKNEEIIDSVYTPETKILFLAKMKEYDPNGLFSAGEGARFLGKPNI
ncbi:hypothetical protein HK096_003192 [Nowakowskiella sp. JEL0078]|nr:hypothetical protein HK096_003192 [Nowakowskiella sp. JEL0078]